MYRCPTHSRWVDNEREAGCPECLASGGADARRARERNRRPPEPMRGTTKAKPRRRWLLYLALMALGASALALPEVQSLLRDQGLGEVADRAEDMSRDVRDVAGKVRDQAQSTADELGVALPGQGDGAAYPLAARSVPLRTTHTGGGSGLAYYPARHPNEPRPVLVWLHAAGQTPAQVVDLLKPVADHYRFAIIAPDALAQEAGFTSFAAGERTLSEDELHVVNCVQEVVDDSRLAVSGAHLMLVGAQGGGRAALHLATRHARFSHVAVLHDAPSVAGLGELKPPLYVSAGKHDALRPPAKVRTGVEDLQGLGYPVQLAVLDSGAEVTRRELTSLVQFWLGMGEP